MLTCSSWCTHLRQGALSWYSQDFDFKRTVNNVFSNQFGITELVWRASEMSCWIRDFTWLSIDMLEDNDWIFICGVAVSTSTDTVSTKITNILNVQRSSCWIIELLKCNCTLHYIVKWQFSGLGIYIQFLLKKHAGKKWMKKIFHV